MYRLMLCGIVLALSHGASLPLGFEMGQQINLVKIGSTSFEAGQVVNRAVTYIYTLT